jgi:hypothetical protein
MAAIPIRHHGEPDAANPSSARDKEHDGTTAADAACDGAGRWSFNTRTVNNLGILAQIDARSRSRANRRPPQPCCCVGSLGPAPGPGCDERLMRALFLAHPWPWNHSERRQLAHIIDAILDGARGMVAGRWSSPVPDRLPSPTRPRFGRLLPCPTPISAPSDSKYRRERGQRVYPVARGIRTYRPFQVPELGAGAAGVDLGLRFI